MDTAVNDLQRAAARARPALAVLTAELGEPSPDAALALVVLGQMLDDIEAGRHQLDRPDTRLLRRAGRGSWSQSDFPAIRWGNSQASTRLSTVATARHFPGC